MDWIVPVSSEESTTGTLLPGTLSAALAAFREHGCVLLRGLFTEATVDALGREYASRYGGQGVDGLRDDQRKMDFPFALSTFPDDPYLE